MEELPTMEDLHNAAMSLSKLRSPSPNGVPVEYYLALWDSVGQLLHWLVISGIQIGRFLPIFIRGPIILIPKSGDERDLDYKCPITLLNVMFKICSKFYQLCLFEACIDLISKQQSAFILGRTKMHVYCTGHNGSLPASKIGDSTSDPQR